MPDTPSTDSSTPSQRPVRRLGRSILVTLQVVSFFIAIIALNYLSCAKHTRLDLTERHDFTLSDLTTKILLGDSVQQRKAPIRIIAVIRRGSPHYSRMRNLLDEYSRLGNDAVELEFVDPARQTDRTLEIANIYNKPYVEDMIIVDARIPKDENTKADGSPVTTAVPESSAKLEAQKQQLSTHVRSVLVKQLYLEDVDQFDTRFIAAWQDEDVITSSLIGSIEGQPRKIYFAADKGNLDAVDGRPAWHVLFNMLSQHNINLVPIRLSDIQSIPDDSEGFALIAPQYDLEDREIQILSEYWDRPKSSVLLTLDPTIKLNKLRIFLRNFGINPRNDRIISKKGGTIQSSVSTLFVRGSEINKDLGGKSTIFDGSSSSLEVRENDDQLMNKRIIPIALIRASDGSWGETRQNLENPAFNPEEDNAAPLYIAAAVLRGRATSDETAALVSKMVVIGNTDFLSQKNLRPEQADFVKSSVNWMIGREELIGIGPRKLHRHKMTLLDSHHSFINKIILIFLPASLILTSLIVWNVRRA